MLRFHGGTLEPEVSPLPIESLEGLVSLVSKNAGTVPYDSTLGDAVAIEETKTTFIEHLQQGGFVGYSILTLGAIALIISLIKLADINRFSVTTPTEMQALARTAREGSIEKGLLRCPWHGWDYDPLTGKAPGFDDGVETFPIEERTDGIYLGLKKEVPHTQTVSKHFIHMPSVSNSATSLSW